MIEEMIKRMKVVEGESGDYERGVTLFYRLVGAFSLTQEGGLGDPLALDRLAKARQEIEGTLAKLPDDSGLRRGLEGELGFFFRWVESVRKGFP